jgi:hypothetical protein
LVVSETIWKFEIPVRDSFEVSMPMGAEVLCVQAQQGEPCIWARVDRLEKKRVDRRFCLRGTGHELGLVGKYIGTFQMRNSTLVFHLFEAP